MREEAITLIMRKFVRQTIVMGNFLLNYILRRHPELVDSEDVRKIRALIQELTEEENHL